MRRSASLAVVLAMGLYGVLALRYVWATSIVVDGARVFTLWDDAMISMRYAHNLAEGHGLVWNPGGERVQGISNLGLTLVMAALHLLPVDGLRQSLLVQLANLGFLVAILALAWRAARALFPDAPGAGPLAALALALYAPLAVWSLQGSDTGAVALCVFLALWLAARAERAGRPWPLAVFAALALGVVVRLDSALFYAAFWGAAVVCGPRRGRSLVAGGTILAATASALLGFGWLYYGDPLPNTYYLKATGAPPAMVLASGISQLRAMLTPISVPLVAFSALALALWGPRRASLLAAAGAAAGVLAYNVRVGGDWLFPYHSRFVVPAVALYLVLHVGAVAHALARCLPPRAPARPGRARRLRRALAAGARGLLLARRRARLLAARAGDALPPGERLERAPRPAAARAHAPRHPAWACTGRASRSTSASARAWTCSGSRTGTSRASPCACASSRPGTRSGTGTGSSACSARTSSPAPATACSRARTSAATTCARTPRCPSAEAPC